MRQLLLGADIVMLDNFDGEGFKDCRKKYQAKVGWQTSVLTRVQWRLDTRKCRDIYQQWQVSFHPCRTWLTFPQILISSQQVRYTKEYHTSTFR